MLGLVLMKTPSKAREAFLYLLQFLALYVSAVSLGTLLFQFVNRWLPDGFETYGGYDPTLQAIRFSVSALIVTFPLFLWMSRSVFQFLKEYPDRRSSGIRQWLTYITLFFAAGTIMGDLISLVNNFLNGELTLRFGLKVLIVGAIASLIFGYYLWDLKKAEL